MRRAQIVRGTDQFAAPFYEHSWAQSEQIGDKGQNTAGN